MKIIAAVLVLIMAVEASAATPTPGSADAAKGMVPDYLGRLFSVVDAPVMGKDGATATVHVQILDRSCDLSLRKHLGANESGWVVERQECKSTVLIPKGSVIELGEDGKTITKIIPPKR
jgi:hypothetical protein